MKRIMVVAIALFVFSSVPTAFAYEEQNANVEVTTTAAGITPDSILYSFERAIESLRLAITTNQEKLARLNAEFAVKRAAEAALMAEQGKFELADKASTASLKSLQSAAIHVEKAIAKTDKAERAIEALTEAHQYTQALLQYVISINPNLAEVLLPAMADQDQTVAAVLGFQVAKQAYASVKVDLNLANTELKAAQESGDAAAISAATEKVVAAEYSKEALDLLKDATKEVQQQFELAVKSIDKATKHVSKSTKRLTKAEAKIDDPSEEKAAKEADKAEEKAKKEAEEAKKAADKAADKAKKRSD